MKLIYPHLYEKWLVLLEAVRRRPVPRQFADLRLKQIQPNYEKSQTMGTLRKVQSHAGFRKNGALPKATPGFLAVPGQAARNINQTMQRGAHGTQSGLFGASIKEMSKTKFAKKFIPEGRVIINNTRNIQEKDNADNTPESRMDPIERVVNNKFIGISATKKNPTVKFNTQKYYSEGVRISMYPPLIKDGTLHPIYRYAPENFDFKATDPA
jgi:hypothetical protein